MNKKVLAIGIAVFTMGISGAALANDITTEGTVLTDYYEIIPENGSAYAGPQERVYDNDNGYCVSDNVGGTYTMNARMIELDNGTAGSWTYRIGDDESVALYPHTNMNVGDSISMEVETYQSNPVSVEVFGQWCSE